MEENTVKILEILINNIEERIDINAEERKNSNGQNHQRICRYLH